MTNAHTPEFAAQAKIDRQTNAQFYLDKLQHEITMLTRGGVIECMVRNPGVSEYISQLEAQCAVLTDACEKALEVFDGGPIQFSRDNVEVVAALRDAIAKVSG